MLGAEFSLTPSLPGKLCLQGAGAFQCHMQGSSVPAPSASLGDGEQSSLPWCSTLIPWHIPLVAQGGGRAPGLWWLDGLPGAVGNSKGQAGMAASPIPPALPRSLRLQDAVCPLESWLCDSVTPAGTLPGQ